MALQAVPRQFDGLAAREPASTLLPPQSRRDGGAGRLSRSAEQELRAVGRRIDGYVEGILALEDAFVAVTVTGIDELAEFDRQRQRLLGAGAGAGASEAGEPLSPEQRARLERAVEESWRDGYGMLRGAQETILQTAQFLPHLLAPRPRLQRVRRVMRGAAAAGRVLLPVVCWVAVVVGGVLLVLWALPLIVGALLWVLELLLELYLIALVMLFIYAWATSG